MFDRIAAGDDETSRATARDLELVGEPGEHPGGVQVCVVVVVRLLNGQKLGVVGLDLLHIAGHREVVVVDIGVEELQGRFGACRRRHGSGGQDLGRHIDHLCDADQRRRGRPATAAFPRRPRPARATPAGRAPQWRRPDRRTTAIGPTRSPEPGSPWPAGRRSAIPVPSPPGRPPIATWTSEPPLARRAGHVLFGTGCVGVTPDGQARGSQGAREGFTAEGEAMSPEAGEVVAGSWWPPARWWMWPGRPGR